MAKSTVGGPWQVMSGHPDGGEHVGYALTEVLAKDPAEITTDESVAAVSRYTSCSCGWVGKQHLPPDAPSDLRVRRYRRQTRETLRPEWEEHVSHWLPEPIPAGVQAGEPATDEPQVSETATMMHKSTDEHGQAAEYDASDVDPAAALRTAASAADVANAAARQTSETLTETVRVARRAGLSWAKVGALTGMSRQSAHERWRV